MYRSQENHHGTHNSRSEPCKVQNCGETQTLAILKEFQKLYEDKLKEIDSTENDDSAELKVRMLQEWVWDLTEQNTMLVQAVEELEKEASERVALLENKLRQTSQASYDQLPTCNMLTEQVECLRSDVRGLLEVIRRARDEGVWSADGLQFYEVNCVDIYGTNGPRCNTIPAYNQCCGDYEVLRCQLEKSERALEASNAQLSQKIQENEMLIQEIAKMDKSARDMRDALTAEVADKHDSIRALRREYQILEEQCRQVDKQAHFKDDIIKEMRKELRSIKTKDDTVLAPLPPDQLMSKLAEYRAKLLAAKNTLETMKDLVDTRYGCMCCKEDRIAQLEGTVKCLYKCIEHAQIELENMQQMSTQYALGSNELDRRIKRTQERLAQLQSEFQNTGEANSLHKMLDEVKLSQDLIKQREKTILKQDQNFGKVKYCLGRTKNELDALKSQAQHYLAEKTDIEKRAKQAERKIEMLQHELLQTYENLQSGVGEYAVDDCNHHQRVQDMQEILSATEAQLNVYQMKIAKLSENNNQLCKTIVQVQTELKHLQERANTQDIQGQDNLPRNMCHLLAELEKTRLESKNSNEQILSLNTENRLLNQQVTILQNELKLAHETLRNKERIRKQTIERKLKALSMDSGLANIQESSETELAASLMEIEQLKWKLRESEAQLRSLQTQTTQLQDMKENLQTTLAADSIKNPRGTLKVCSPRICGMQIKTGDSTKEQIIENLQKAVHLHQNTITELEKQQCGTSAFNDQQQFTIHSLEGTLSTVKRDWDEVQKEVSEPETWGWPDSDSGLRPRHNRRALHDN